MSLIVLAHVIEQLATKKKNLNHPNQKTLKNPSHHNLESLYCAGSHGEAVCRPHSQSYVLLIQIWCNLCDLSEFHPVNAGGSSSTPVYKSKHIMPRDALISLCWWCLQNCHADSLPETESVSNGDVGVFLPALLKQQPEALGF